MKKQLEQWRGVLQEDHDNGFSLLEVVVAVSIMLILAVVGTLGYQGYQDNARDAAVETAAQQVYTAGLANLNSPNGDELSKVASDYTNSADGITTTITQGEEDICVHAVMDERPEHAANRGDCEGVDAPAPDDNNNDNEEDNNGSDTDTGGAIAVAPPRSLVCDGPLIGRPAIEWIAPDTGAPAEYVIEVRHVISGETRTHVVDGDTSRIVLTGDALTDLLDDMYGLGGNFSVQIASQSSGVASEFTGAVEFYAGLDGLLLPSCV